MTLLPAYAEIIIQKGIEGYSTLLLGSGIGALLGGGMLALFGNLKNSSKLQFICTLGIGISLILFSQSTWIYTSVLILIFVAGFNSAFAAINNTIISNCWDRHGHEITQTYIDNIQRINTNWLC